MAHVMYLVFSGSNCTVSVALLVVVSKHCGASCVEEQELSFIRIQSVVSTVDTCYYIWKVSQCSGRYVPTPYMCVIHVWMPVCLFCPLTVVTKL